MHATMASEAFLSRSLTVEKAWRLRGGTEMRSTNAFKTSTWPSANAGSRALFTGSISLAKLNHSSTSHI